MADYSNPFMPNVLSNAYAINTMQGLVDRQNQNAANLEASNAIGRGDYGAAEQAYRRVGLNEQADAAKLKGLNTQAGQLVAGGDYGAAASLMLKHGYFDQADKFNEQEHQDIKRTYDLGAQIAQIPGLTPEQWSQFMTEAKKDGFDTSMFEDPKTGPALMAAHAGKVTEYNEELRKQKAGQSNINERAARVVAGVEPWPAATKGDTEALAVQAKVRELDPNFTADRFKYRTNYLDPNKSVQKSLGAFETALHHAKTISDSVENISDTGWAPTTGVYHFFQRMGGNEALENYEDTATAFARELDKAFTGGVGAAGEREEASRRISSSKPKGALLSGNAANVELMIGKMLAFENQWRKANGPNVPPPQSLTDDEREIAREIFAKEPDDKLKQDRYDRLIRDSRTADLVREPIEGERTANASGIKTARPAELSDDEIRSWAKRAIARGVPADTVNARLRTWGINP